MNLKKGGNSMTRSKGLGYFFLFIALLLLLNNLGLLSGHAFLLVLGLGFIAVYALLGGRKRYGTIGLFIPGTILISIWISITLENHLDLGAFEGAHFLFLMGLAFLSILLFHTYSFKEKSHGDRFWPIYPALGLILIGALSYFSQTLGRDFTTTFGKTMNYIWVLVFLGIGLKIILGRDKPTPTHDDNQEEEEEEEEEKEEEEEEEEEDI